MVTGFSVQLCGSTQVLNETMYIRQHDYSDQCRIQALGDVNRLRHSHPDA
jgi:hypothetical protein